MTIRVRLTSSFTLIVITILVIFSFSIYYFSAKTREESAYLRLKTKSGNTAKRFVDMKGITGELLKAIDKNTSSVSVRGNVAIYNQTNQKVYTGNDEEPTQTPSLGLLNEIRLKGEVRFRDGEKEAVGILFKGKDEQVVVIASAIDEIGLKSLNNLKLILIIGLLFATSVSVFAGYLFSGQALRPIANVVKQVGEINSKTLSKRIHEGNGTDEIAQLAIEFNKMIHKLEAAFEMQRSFVSNASHELRTPLTAIGGQIDVALMNESDRPEYRTVLQSIREDISNMSKLSNGLFDLAQTSFETSAIQLKDARVDELILESRDELMKRQKEYSIHVEYSSLEEDERKLTVTGSEQLLKTAIINLMDNACKYSSDKSVSVKIASNEKDRNISLEFLDKGMGISPQDLKHVFEPFYRASNTHGIAGHGIGLSLVEKIVDLHKGYIELNSLLGKGTNVLIKLPYC